MVVHILIRKKVARSDSATRAPLYLRIRDGRCADIWVRLPLYVNPNVWDKRHEQIRTNSACDRVVRELINLNTKRLKLYLERRYLREMPLLTARWVKDAVNEFFHPKPSTSDSVHRDRIKAVEAFGRFLETHKISQIRKQNFMVLERVLRRFEFYIRITEKNDGYVIYLDEADTDFLQKLWYFMENEHIYYKKYPIIYRLVPLSRTPSKRGRNTMLDCFRRLRTFFIWCGRNNLTNINPFENFRLEECTYGTPVYISINERNRIYETDLSAFPDLAVQRDIFIFQCLVGCRVGDLFKLKQSNIINGALEYIPTKTKTERPVTVRVPLHPIAMKIVRRYWDYSTVNGTLLPFIIVQKYNKAIKRIFLIAGVSRIVTVLNPTTGEEVKRPLHEIASSHLARRTFVGNLYKQVKDPNLVCALSGHKEGSKSFLRYREIDDDMKNELVKLL